MWGESTTPGLSVWGPRKAKKPEDEPVEALKLPPMSPEKAKDKSGKLVAPSRPTKENQLLVLVEHHLGIRLCCVIEWCCVHLCIIW
jgi:hypothetical protein